jgi:signal transduction histidine kinase
VVLRRLLPGRLAGLVHSRGGQFLALLLAFGLAIGFVLVLIYQHSSGAAPPERALVRDTLWPVFLSLMVVSGVAAWLVVLAHESRRAAEAESGRQTSMLMEEIDAHQRTDAALQKAKEVAEAANVAKTRYLVGISHEIRTPLNSIFGYAQLLERGQLASASNAVRIIRRGAEHLVSLVDGLLDISKIESGLLRLSRERVPLPEFLDQIVDMFRLQAAARGLEFDHQRPPKLPGHVYADQKRLRQVLINLLSNAIKYTAAGRVSFNVRFRSQVAEFEITDTGFGIASGDLERIFEPFERGASASVRAIPGTGLGLTITRLLTQLMGGDLHVRSTPGEGSCFTLRLMLSEAAPASGAQIVARSVTGYIGPVRRILVIDDDPLHCELVSELLEPLGFEVHAARDAASALAQVPALAPDLILLDLSLPDLSGWELAARLRELPGMVGVPILVVSANAHDYGSLGSGLHEGFLAKPIDLQVLLGHIGELLQLGWRLDGAERSGERAAALPGVEQPRPRAHLDALYQLGRIGHVRGIEDRLRQLELEDPASQALVAQLRALVANFDLRRYMSVIEAVRSHE